MQVEVPQDFTAGDLYVVDVSTFNVKYKRSLIDLGSWESDCAVDTGREHNMIYGYFCDFCELQVASEARRQRRTRFLRKFRDDSLLKSDDFLLKNGDFITKCIVEEATRDELLAEIQNLNWCDSSSFCPHFAIILPISSQLLT